MLLAGGYLLEKRRRDSAGETVGRAALFPHAQRRAGLEINRASQRVGALVPRVALGEFERLEHRASDALQLKGAIQVHARQQATVDRHRIELRIHPANVEPICQALVRRAAEVQARGRGRKRAENGPLLPLGYLNQGYLSEERPHEALIYL